MRWKTWNCKLCNRQTSQNEKLCLDMLKGIEWKADECSDGCAKLSFGRFVGSLTQKSFWRLKSRKLKDAHGFESSLLYSWLNYFFPIAIRLQQLIKQHVNAPVSPATYQTLKLIFDPLVLLIFSLEYVHKRFFIAIAATICTKHLCLFRWFVCKLRPWIVQFRVARCREFILWAICHSVQRNFVGKQTQ